MFGASSRFAARPAGAERMEEVDAEVAKLESPVTQPNTSLCATSQLAIQPRVEVRCCGSTAGARQSVCSLHFSRIGQMSLDRQMRMIVAHVMLCGDAAEEAMNVK